MHIPWCVAGAGEGSAKKPTVAAAFLQWIAARMSHVAALTSVVQEQTLYHTTDLRGDRNGGFQPTCMTKGRPMTRKKARWIGRRRWCEAHVLHRRRARYFQNVRHHEPPVQPHSLPTGPVGDYRLPRQQVHSKCFAELPICCLILMMSLDFVLCVILILAVSYMWAVAAKVRNHRAHCIHGNPARQNRRRAFTDGEIAQMLNNGVGPTPDGLDATPMPEITFYSDHEEQRPEVTIIFFPAMGRLRQFVYPHGTPQQHKPYEISQQK